MSQQKHSAIRISLLFWCLFILYGSFVPFHFTTDPAVVRENLAKVQIYPFQDGRRNFSILDAASNVLLFVPFGFLAAMTGRTIRSPLHWMLRIAIVGFSAAAFATAIEGEQLFTTERTSSVIDVMFNATGAMGAVGLAWMLSRFLTRRLSDSILERVRKEPVLLLLGLMGIALTADAFYPFAITLDVSTAWQNLKSAHLLPFVDRMPRFWVDLILDKVLMFSFFAAALRRSLQSLRGKTEVAVSSWLATVLFGAVLEIGKLGFEGRFPNADTVALAAFGALVGVTLVPMIVGSAPVRSHPMRALLVLALVLVTHAGLTPFEFRLTDAAIADKLARIEWLPFAAYYYADSQKAGFDLWQKLLCYGLLGFSVAGLETGKRWMPLAVGLAVGVIIETAQLLTVARSTSVTDVLISGIGGLLGGMIYTRYRSWQDSVSIPAETG
jgi:glycopeptide antibiotics resistance protein